MRYLLDTSVISELVARQPNRQVLQWLRGLDPESIYLSVITIGEIRKGVEKLPDSKRKAQLTSWLNEELLIQFDGHILPIGTEVMLLWGSTTSALEHAGKTMPAMDSLIAATALHGDLILVTRNEDDFEHSSVTLFNPWQSVAG